MSQEYPNVICRSIDVETRNDRASDQLFAELFAPPVDQVIAYRGNHRWTQSFEPVRIKGSTATLRDEGVYVITGGLGNVGLVIAEWIAEHARGARLALLGRSTLPSRDTLANARLMNMTRQTLSARSIRRVQRLEELGAEVSSVSADVGDEQQMRAAFAKWKNNSESQWRDTCRGYSRLTLGCAARRSLS